MKKKAFSLIELLIVIVIIGVVYNLSVTNFQKRSDEVENITLLNLKKYLKSLDYKESAKLLCLDNCRSCDILVDGEKSIHLEDFLDESVKVYRYDYLSGAQEIMQEVYFNEEDIQEDVCFSYTVDKNGIGDQVFVEFKESVYDYTTYLIPTQKYNSLEEVIETKEKLVEEVSR